jgi:hypothetical protein
MTSDMTKLLKHVDGDIYRRFRAHCIAEGMTMGPAISTLMLGVLKGKITLKDGNGEVTATTRPGSWSWPGDREGGNP